jgi:hypothetical protein
MALLKNIDEIKKYISVDHNTYFESLAPYVDEAEDYFIKDLLSESLYDAINEDYNKTDLQPIEERFAKLLPYVQRALANYAYYQAISISGINVSDIGLQVQSSNNSMPAPQWKIEKFEKSLLKSADRAADKLLEFLENNADDYTEWATSESFTKLKGSFVSTTTILNQFVNIDFSRRVFLKLKSYLLIAEVLKVQKLMCTPQYNRLKNGMIEGNLTDAEKQLIKYIQPVVAKYALYTAIPELRIAITDTGININSFSDGIKRRDGASDLQIKALRENTWEQYQHYEESLKFFLLQNADEYPLYKESPCFENKATPGPKHRIKNNINSSFFGV